MRVYKQIANTNRDMKLFAYYNPRKTVTSLHAEIGFLSTKNLTLDPLTFMTYQIICTTRHTECCIRSRSVCAFKMNFLQKTIQRCYSRRSFPLSQRPNLDKITNLLFGKYLLATNTLSSGLLMVVGDLISQEIEFRKGTLTERYNWKRSGMM